MIETCALLSLKWMTVADIQSFGRSVTAFMSLCYCCVDDPRDHHKSGHRMLQQVSVAIAISVPIIKGYCSSQLL